MPSSSTRLEIVQRAVKLGGRSAELYGEAKAWLNDLLGHLAEKNKYPALFKVFDRTLTLSAGGSTVAFPSDMGAGVESIVLDNEGTPLTELAFDDYVSAGCFQPTNASPGRPTAYFVDKNARVIRFNCAANKAYSLSGGYYQKPVAYAVDATDDDTQIWYSDDATIVEGLVQKVYQYTGDQREFIQDQKFQNMDANFRRGNMPMSGGVQRVRLSSKFKGR